jgi:hypothetical protein
VVLDFKPRASHKCSATIPHPQSLHLNLIQNPREDVGYISL